MSSAIKFCPLFLAAAFLGVPLDPAHHVGARSVPVDTLLPTQEKQERTDLYGDPLPPGALARLGTVRFRTGGLLHALTFSPDGKKVASAAEDRTIQVWDVQSGKTSLTLSDHPSIVSSITFSPDGEQIIAGGGDASRGSEIWKSIYIWNARTGDLIRNIETHDQVKMVAVSTDAKVVASIAREGRIQLWEVATGKQLTRLEVAGSDLTCVAFSPDGKTITCASDGKPLVILDAESGRQLDAFEVEVPSVRYLSYFPDGLHLAARVDSLAVQLLDTKTKKLVRALKERGGVEYCFAISADGKAIVTGGWEETILWNTSTGNVLLKLPRGSSRVALSPDGNLVATGMGGIHLYETSTGKERFPGAGHDGRVSSLAFSPDGKIIASGGWDATIRIWEANTGKEIRCIAEHESAVNSVAFSPDGKWLASGSADVLHQIRIWDVKTGALVRKIHNNGNHAFSVAFSNDGKTLLSVGGGAILWDTQSGKEIREFLPGDGVYGGAAVFSPSGGSVAIGNAKTGLAIHSTTTGEELLHYTPPEGIDPSKVDSLAYSPAGNMIVFTDGIGSSGHIIDASSGKELFRLEGHDEPVRCVALSPDGKLAATGDRGGIIRLWEIDTATGVRVLRGHRGDIRSLAFSPDGKTLGSAGTDSAILVWNLAPRDSAEATASTVDAIALEADWELLASKDGPTAYAAGWRLAAAGDLAAPVLKSKLVPVSSETLEAWIKDLDGDNVEARESASSKLFALGTESEAALRKRLETSPSQEAQSRIKKILDDFKGPTLHSQGTLRRSRAIQVLERIGTDEARKVLHIISQSSPGDRERKEAQAAILRLSILAEKK